jgi:hypothetical protein
MNDDRLREVNARILAGRTGSGRRGCPPPESLMAVVTRAGSEPERLKITNHVMTCPHCLPEFELLRSLDVAAPEAAPSRRWLALAASIVVLIASGVVLRGVLQPGEPVLRGTAGVQLVLPAEGEVVGPDARLSWRTVRDAVSYQVEILTTAGSVVRIETTRDTTLAIGSLPDGGSYLWQVTADRGSGGTVQSRPGRFRVGSP